jgi:hypothetical protein
MHHGAAVIPAKVWPTPGHRWPAAGTGGQDRHAFRADRPGAHDIYRRWDPGQASHSRAGPRPDAGLAERGGRDRHAAALSFRQGDPQGRRFDHNQRLEDRRQWPRADAPRWVRPADRMNSQDRAAAPRSPGVHASPRPGPVAPPAWTTPRSPGLLADDPRGARSHPRQFDRRVRPDSEQGMQPEVPRRVFRDDVRRPALQDPRPSMPPRMRQQERRRSVNAPPSWPEARREFRSPPRQELRRDQTRFPPAASAPGGNITAPSRQHDWRRERTRPSAAATAPGNRVTPPRARSDSFMRDSGPGSGPSFGNGSGFRSSPGFGSYQGRPAAR